MAVEPSKAFICPVCVLPKKHHAKGYCRNCYANSRGGIWAKKNPERAKEIRRNNATKYRAADPLKQKRYYAANKTKEAKRAAAYHKKNVAVKRERLKVWRAANPKKVAEHIRTRRARRYNAPVCDLTAEQWKEIKKQHKQRCRYCGKKRKLTQDHVVPLENGGSHTASNIVPACKNCNSSKGTKPVSVFLAEQHGSSL